MFIIEATICLAQENLSNVKKKVLSVFLKID